MPDSEPLIGRTISHYRIVEKLGAGGMGEVYRARDTQLDRDVAVKILPAGALATELARKQFRKEALALARLNHPNIETVFEFNSQDGLDFLVLELIPGQPLSEKLKESPLPEPDIVRLGVQLAEGLAAAHSEGVIHRDLKPANLFATPAGRLKILDFGLAKLRHPELDASATRGMSESVGGISGTVPYMSPEQLRGLPADPRSDIYAAGAVLYEMATGRRPFPQTQSAELMGAILHECPPAPTSLNPRLSWALGSLILKALEKDAARRYQSARELQVVLESLSSRATPAAAAKESPSAAIHRASFPRSARWGVAAAILVLIGFLAAFAFDLGGIRNGLFPSVHALTNKDTIVLADFSNTTGDPVFDGALRRGLSVQLEQSPFLSMVSDDSIQQTLQMMRQKADAKLTPEIAQEICVRTGSAAVLDGAIAQIGTQYLLTLKAVNCSSGDTLASTEAEASDKNHVLDALGKTATDMRNKLGESLGTVQKFNTPVQQATTLSLEALKAFSSGYEVMSRDSPDVAIPFFKQAIELDPNFAAAYAWLGIMYTSLGEPAIAVGYTRKAYELRDRTSEPERYLISAVYYKEVTGDIPKAVQTCKLWMQAYPRAEMPHTYLAGAIYPVLGEYEKAVEESRESIRLSPEYSIPYAFVMHNAICLNRLEEAKTAYRQAVERKLQTAFFPHILYEIAFLEHDAAAMSQQVAMWAGNPAVEGDLLSLESDTAAYSGRLTGARDLSRRAVDAAEQAGEEETAATYFAKAALREALFGNQDQARQRAAQAMERTPGVDAEYGSALALAYAGDAGRALVLAADLGKMFPEYTIVQANYLPTLRAELAIRRGNASNALEYLRAAALYEFGESTYSVSRWTSLYPVYVRGEAYLAARRGMEAAAEFQKILSHPGIVLNEPIGALAHLGLARAYALQAKSAQGAEAQSALNKARAAYQDFLALWKDADPDISILKQAKAEYANLK